MEDIESLLGEVDAAFVIDTTSSMHALLAAAKEDAVKQAREIAGKGGLDYRLALVEYRDHPPQDQSFVTRVTQFTDLDSFQEALTALYPLGGGDRDEAVYDGLLAAGMELEWRPQAEKLCFLIGDSPPHNPCLCGALPGGVVEVLGAKGIRLHAYSIEGAPDTTAEFKELTDALGGATRTGVAAVYASFTGDTLRASSHMVESARVYTSTARGMSASAGGQHVNSVSVSSSLGWSEEHASDVLHYLRETRVISDEDMKITDEIVSDTSPATAEKPKRSRKKKS